MLLIKNGNIHIGNGTILNEHDILIDKKKILEIGKGIKREGSKIIEAKGKEIFPGFIDPVSHIGVLDNGATHSDNEESSSVKTIEMNIKYAFNPVDMELEELYKVGITSVGITPGNTNVINGTTAVVKTKGKSLTKMLVKENVALKCSVTNLVKKTYGEKNIFPKTKMGIFNILEEMLKNKDTNIKKEEKDIVDKVLNKEMPVFVTANTKQEIDATIKIAEKYNINYTICNGYQFGESMDAILKSNANFIIGEQILLSKGNYNKVALDKVNKLLEENKIISFTMTPESYGAGREKYLWNAIEIYKAGVKSEDVLQMMTLQAAKILGVEDKIGSVEVGKDADLVVYSNNPIECYRSRVIYTIIDGEIIYNEGDDTKCC